MTQNPLNTTLSLQNMRHLAIVCSLLLLMTLQGIARAAQPPADWWSAIRRDDLSAVQGMLLRGVDPTALNSIGNPALTQAIREQSWKVFDVLRGAPGVNLNQANQHDETPLMYLCILGETDRARALINAGAQVNRLGWTPLHYAASKAQVDTARLLIEHKAIINAPGPDGTTPLMMAAYSGKEAIVRLLLEHGADITMFNLKHETVEDWAIKGKHTSLAKKLAALEADTVRAGRAGADGKIAQPAAAAASEPPAAKPETEDKSSFSRYFDADRFVDTPAGQ